jgi:chitodextrinase
LFLSNTSMKSRIILATSLLVVPAYAAELNAPASFRVTNEVINAGVEPFTATISTVGNSLLSASYEPVNFRTRIFAGGDSPDRLIASHTELSNWESYRKGFYDGADVRVYRIIDGKMRLVRRDKVAVGGSHYIEWRAVVGGRDKLIAPTATQAQWRFEDYNRPDASYYFAVVAVDKDGNASPASNVSTVVKKSGRGGRVDHPVTVDFKAPNNKTDNHAPPAPTNFKAVYDAATQMVSFSWDAANAPDLAGYRVVRSDYAPEQHDAESYLQLEGRPQTSEAAIKQGDWVFVAKEFRRPSRREMLSNRVFDADENRKWRVSGLSIFPDENPNLTWELVEHDASSPVKDGGQTAAKITLKEGGKFTHAVYNHASTEQSYYQVLDPNKEYIVEAWLKQEDATKPEVSFSFTGPYARKVNPIKFTPDGTWKKYSATFKVPDLYTTGGIVGQMVLQMEGAGTFYMDNYRVYEKGADFLDYYPYEYEALKKSGMNALRTHAFIKTGNNSYTMEGFTNAAGSVSGIVKGNTLPQNLNIMKKAGVVPWIQVEMHMAPEEWQGLVEYLSAPYDPAKDTPKTKPWAYKRYTQGQQRPWIDEFPKMIFEISNETWNWLFQPWVFEGLKDGATGKNYNRGEAYGLFQEYVREELTKSPYWSQLEPKWEMALGGWSGYDNMYSIGSSKYSPNSKYLTVAYYNGGWDEGEGPATATDDSLFRVMTVVAQTGIQRDNELIKIRDEVRQNGINPKLEVGTYEAGPGYALSGLNNQPRMSAAEVRAQEEAMKSLGAGTATLDAFLNKAASGFKIQNFFTYKHGGTHWVSHAAQRQGGQAYPSWLGLEMFNNHGTGDFLNVQTLTVPTVDLPSFRRRREVKNAPLATAYATRKGNRVTLFVLSRKLDKHPDPNSNGFTPVTVELPFSKVAGMKLYKMAGDPRAHNLDSEQVKIEEVTLAASNFTKNFILGAKTGADERGLPAGSTFMYVFEGVE